MDEKLLEIIDEKIGIPLENRDNNFGVTIKEYSKARNCSDEIARKMLESGVEMGILGKVMMIIGEKSTAYVYYKIMTGNLDPKKLNGKRK